MGVVSAIFSFGKFLLWVIGIYGAAKFCDHYIFPAIMPSRSLEKMQLDLEGHYKLDPAKLQEFGIEKEKYTEVNLDEESREFLKHCQSLQTRYFAFFGQSIVYTYLKPFVTLTSLHGLLNRGSMFVLSSGHLETVLKNKEIKTVVDLGAGDGKVTRKIEKFTGLSPKDIQVTDVSPSMKYRLAEKGFNVVDAEYWYSKKPFDLISMLNLLDRCTHPMKMLTDAKNSLTNNKNSNDGGRLLISSVFPFRQSIEWRNSRKADELVKIDSRWSLEQQAAKFIKDVVEPNGFELESISRVPYLCEGDIKQPYYILSNVVMVFRLKVDAKND